MNKLANILTLIFLTTPNHLFPTNYKNVHAHSSKRNKESQEAKTRELSKFNIFKNTLNNEINDKKNNKYTSHPNGSFSNGSGRRGSSPVLTAKAVLLCGGIGNRFNYDFSEYAEGTYYVPEGVPETKQFIHIYNVPLFVYSLSELIHNPVVSEIVIVSKPAWYPKIVEMILRSREFISNYSNEMEPPGYTVDLIDNYSTDRVFALAYDFQEKDFVSDLEFIEDEEHRYKFIKFSESGPERFHSTYNALSDLEGLMRDEDIVLIHDGARPLVKFVDLENLVKVAEKYGAAIPGYQSPDTVKLVNEGKVSQTLDRSKTFIIQTPQAFKYRLVKQAYDNVMESNPFKYEPKLSKYFTDDASFLESQLTNCVAVVDGHKFNMKLTYQSDLDLFRFLIQHTLFRGSAL